MRLLSIAGASGAIVSDDYEGTSPASIVLMAATGAGIGILPDLFARRQGIHRSEVRVMPLVTPDSHCTISLLVPSDRTEKFAGALARILRSAAKALDLNVIE